MNIYSNKNDLDVTLASLGDFHFAEYMIYSDMWSVCIDSHSDNQYAIYNKGEQLITLTYSLSNFLFLLFKRGVFEGLYIRMEEKAG